MQLRQFTFIVTDDCNFDCSYCVQGRGNNYLDAAAIEKATKYFFPYFDKEVHIIFYGGEPLLAFDQIRGTLALLKELNADGDRKFTYSMTTNGSLLNDEMLEFFNTNSFSLCLSFDGPAQETCREPDSLRHTTELVAKIRNFPNITFSVNSVFTPQTVETMSEAIPFILEAGCPEMQYALDTVKPWDDAALQTLERELTSVHAYLSEQYKEKEKFPVINLRSVPG
ncbi:MAG: radical SAM protein, partial [bacterium]|nr:radical SAM protein [bacterium]